MPYNWQPAGQNVWVLGDGTTGNLGAVTKRGAHLGGSGGTFVADPVLAGSPRVYPSLVSAKKAVEAAVAAGIRKAL
jgi:hypothetical protein